PQIPAQRPFPPPPHEPRVAVGAATGGGDPLPGAREDPKAVTTLAT
ncbi:unnamed protein product, partial [Urochloa humidicola]